MNYMSSRMILWGILGFFCMVNAGQENPFYDESNPFYVANMCHDRSDYRGAIDAYSALFEKVDSGEIEATQEQLADAHLNYGQACWACDNFKTGFAELNKYMGKTGDRSPLNDALIRQDIKNIEGGDKYNILARATDGFGDTFTFLKMLKPLKARGAHITVIVQGPLQKLLSRSTECADLVITDEDPEPSFDRDVYLMVLGHFVSNCGVCGVKTSKNIPRGIGYIHPQEQKVQFWTKLIKKHGKRPLGICPDSSTNPVPGGRVLHRNVGYKNMARLSEVKDARLYNLLSGLGRKPITQREYDTLPFEEQKERANDVVTDEQMGVIYNFDPDTFDKDEPFGDTAAFMQAIKMHKGYVVSSDTSIPNLAGGVSADTCLLLDYHADARWGEVDPGACAKPNRFFECVKDFRQETEGDWGPVMDKVIKYINEH